MECMHCKGELKRGTAKFSIDRNGYHIAVDDVPAWICSQCGEAMFDETEVAALQDMIRELDERARQIRVSA